MMIDKGKNKGRGGSERGGKRQEKEKDGVERGKKIMTNKVHYVPSLIRFHR